MKLVNLVKIGTIGGKDMHIDPEQIVAVKIHAGIPKPYCVF